MRRCGYTFSTSLAIQTTKTSKKCGLADHAARDEHPLLYIFRPILDKAPFRPILQKSAGPKSFFRTWLVTPPRLFHKKNERNTATLWFTRTLTMRMIIIRVFEHGNVYDGFRVEERSWLCWRLAVFQGLNVFHDQESRPYAPQLLNGNPNAYTWSEMPLIFKEVWDWNHFYLLSRLG